MSTSASTNSSKYANKFICLMLFLAVPIITIPICSTVLYQYYQVHDYNEQYCNRITNHTITEIWGSYSHCDGLAIVINTLEEYQPVVHIINPAIDYYLIQTSYQECQEWIEYYSTTDNYICYIKGDKGYTSLPSITSWLLILIFSSMALVIMIFILIRVIINRNNYIHGHGHVCTQSTVRPPSYNSHERDSLIPHPPHYSDLDDIPPSSPPHYQSL